MQHIETVTVGSGGAASITFSAIPDTFTDLLVVISARNTRADGFVGVYISLNGSTSSFTNRYLQGLGTSGVASGTLARYIGAMPASTSTANTFGNVSVYFPNYRSSASKSFSGDSVSENNAGLSFQELTAHLWSVSDAITSISFAGEFDLFAEHSTASLYGILAGSDGTTVVS